jgi:hypothetical protein
MRQQWPIPGLSPANPGRCSQPLSVDDSPHRSIHNLTVLHQSGTGQSGIRRSELEPKWRGIHAHDGIDCFFRQSKILRGSEDSDQRTSEIFQDDCLRQEVVSWQCFLRQRRDFLPLLIAQGHRIRWYS